MMRGERRIRGALLLTALAFCATLALHPQRGAFRSGFGAHEDEAAHLVTGLMAHDYLVDPTPRHPVRYAEQYYVHYPKVAIGQWPPVFYGLQALWALPFGHSTMSMLSFMSALTAACALLVFLALRRSAGGAVAALAALLLVLLPLVQTYSARIMTEVPLALLCTAAVLAFGRFLETRRAGPALLFAALSTLAILTKGSALALALLPALAIPLSGRLEVLKRPVLWLAGGLVALCCLPWYLATVDISSTTWAGGASPSLTYTLDALPAYLRGLVGLGGAAVGALAVLGAITGLRDPATRARRAAVVAWIPSLVLLHVAIPSSIDARHLVAAAPAWAILFGDGVAALQRALPGLSVRGLPLVPALACVPFLVGVLEVPEKRYSGYAAAARRLVEDPRLRGSVLLVSSDSIGSGLFIAGVALAEERPGHVVLRADKVLATSDWLGGDYRRRFEAPEEIGRYLRSVPVGVVVVDHALRRPAEFAHHDQLLQVVRAGAGPWRLFARHDVTRAGVLHEGALEIYVQEGHQTLPQAALEFVAVAGRRPSSL